MQEFQAKIIGPTGDCAVLQISGDLDAYTAPALRQRMLDLGDDGVVHVIADMRQVDFLDSTGLGVLIGGLKRFREHGGSLAPVITTVFPYIRRVRRGQGPDRMRAEP